MSWSNEGTSSVIYERRGWRGCEADGANHLDRITARPRDHLRRPVTWLQQSRRLSVCHQPVLGTMKTATLLPPLNSLSFYLPLPLFFPFPMWLPPPPSLASLSPITQLPFFLLLLLIPEPFHPCHTKSLPPSYDLSLSFGSCLSFPSLLATSLLF